MKLLVLLVLDVYWLQDFVFDFVWLRRVGEVVLVVAKATVFMFKVCVICQPGPASGQWYDYVPPPMLPISLSCVPSSRSSSSALGEPDMISSSESMLQGDGDGRSDIGVPGVWRRVVVLRDFASCNESSRAVSEAFRFLCWEVVVARRGAAASQSRRQSARQRRNDGNDPEGGRSGEWVGVFVAIRRGQDLQRNEVVAGLQEVARKKKLVIE